MLNRLKVSLQVGIALILVLFRNRKQRRWLMLWCAVGIMAYILVGLTVLDAELTELPIVFAVYWLLAFVMLFFLILLAIYDMAATVREIRSEQNDD